MSILISGLEEKGKRIDCRNLALYESEKCPFEWIYSRVYLFKLKEKRNKEKKEKKPKKRGEDWEKYVRSKGNKVYRFRTLA